MPAPDQNTPPPLGESPPPPPPALAPQPEKFGGWLILPILGLIATPFLVLNAAVADVGALCMPNIDLVEEEYPGIKLMIGGEILLNVLILCCWLWATIVFFRKKSIAPIAMVSFFSFKLIVDIIDTAAAYVVFRGNSELLGEDSLTDVLRSLLACAIWIPYFLLSKRVKNTFTRP